MGVGEPETGVSCVSIGRPDLFNSTDSDLLTNGYIRTVKRPLFSCLLLFLLLGFQCAAQDNELDSLKQIIAVSADDSNKVNLLNKVGVQYYSSNASDSAFRYAWEAVDLATRLEFKRGLALSYSIIGNIYFDRGVYSESLKYNLRALQIREETGDERGTANGYNNIGNVYLSLHNYDEALKNHQAALSIRERIRDTVGLGFSYNNLGIVFDKQKNFAGSVRSYAECVRIKLLTEDTSGAATAYTNMGNVFVEMQQYDTARVYLYKGLLIHEAIGDEQGMEIDYVNLCNLYNHMNVHDTAEYYGLKALDLATAIGDVESVIEANLQLSEIYRKTGRFEEALMYYTRYTGVRDSLFNEESIQNIVRTQLEHDFEKERTMKELVAAEEKLQTRIVLVLVSSVLLLALLLAVFFYLNSIKKQRVNELVMKQKKEVEAQKKVIEEKNADITASITYAQRIQQAILPSEESILEKFPESFVFYRPKDIVAGDFYWVSDAVTKYEEKFVMAAVADCTGHGVPGALMSAIGNNFLRLCEHEPTVNRPSEALDFINAGISRTFRQEYSRSDIKDGMDMVFVAIDYHTMQLHFAGAKNPIYIIRNGVFTEYAGDKHPIGSYVGEEMKKFTNHTIAIQKGDCVYLFTDGFADQFGGPEGKKYMYRRFKNLLTELSTLPMSEQRIRIRAEFDAWIGSREQVDDICVFGIRI